METMTATETVHTMANMAAFLTARDTGNVVEIDEELYWYYLEVLPPVRMHYWARVSNPDGTHRMVMASFGFAEGWEPITAFWAGKHEDKGKYFCQLTNEMNRC